MPPKISGVGIDLVDLKRIRIDNIVDRGLETGEWRELTAGEIKQVMAK